MPNGNVGTFARAVDVDRTFADFEFRYRDLTINKQRLRALYDKQKRDVLYLSEFYQVAIDKDPPHNFPGATMWHLSIKRLDKDTIFDWRDLQAIKNRFCGDEAEGVQLFPAESRLVDTSNQYHIWVFMKMNNTRLPRLPVGWDERMVEDEGKAGSRQRAPMKETK